jgi:hypothetical protein
MSFEGQTFSELFLQASRKLVNTDNFTTCWNLQNNLTHGQYKCRTISRLSELTSTPPIQFLKGTKDIILKKNSATYLLIHEIDYLLKDTCERLGRFIFNSNLRQDGVNGSS